MTPLHINIMLHHYAIAEPYGTHQPEHQSSTAVRQYHAELVAKDMLKVEITAPSGYTVTERGMVYIAALTHLELPISVTEWRMP